MSPADQPTQPEPFDLDHEADSLDCSTQGYTYERRMAAIRSALLAAWEAGRIAGIDAANDLLCDHALAEVMFPDRAATVDALRVAGLALEKMSALPALPALPEGRGDGEAP